MLRIRRAEAGDVPQILALVRELAEYEKVSHEVKATEADLLRDGFSGTPRFFVEMAEWEGAPAGFALWFYNYSTWEGRPGLYLEDLFVRPPLRGRFQWQVLDWNTPAIEFYEGLGAKALKEWITMRVSGIDIARLAEL